MLSRAIVNGCGSSEQQLRANFASRSKNYHHKRRRKIQLKNDLTVLEGFVEGKRAFEIISRKDIMHLRI